jgi:AraC family transcriptional regulator
MEYPFSHKELTLNGVIVKSRKVSEFLLAELNYPPSLEISSHAHEHANFCMAIKGGCTELYARKTREYKPFTLGFLPPHQTHSVKSSSRGVRAFSIDIEQQWLERMRKYSLNVEDAVYCAGGVLISLQIKLYHEFQNIDAASPLAVEGLVLEMLAEVSRHQAKESNPPRWLKKAKGLIREQVSTCPSLEVIAQQVGVHPVHLARTFRKFYRCNVGEYIRSIRIDDACRKMIGTSTPLIQIALNAGFADQSHFTRTFKRFKGMTPAKYRIKSATD